MDINYNKILEALNDKMDADFNNVSRGGVERFVNWTMPDYENGIEVSAVPLKASPFTAPADGYLTAQFWDNNNISFYLNGIVRPSLQYEGASSNQCSMPAVIPLRKGDIIYWAKTVRTFRGMTFYPCKGVEND